MILSDREATRKYKKSKQFLDLCDNCFADVSDQIETLENPIVSNSLDNHEYEEEE